MTSPRYPQRAGIAAASASVSPMAGSSRTSQARLVTSRIARVAARVVVAGSLVLSLPLLGSLTSDGVLPSAVASAVDSNVRLNKRAVPVRIRLPGIGIDLPVVSSERNLRGNPRDYPLCDVAEYWTAYDLPGAPGTAWIYAHAQPGMFLPLFTTSEATNGDGLLGQDIEVQLADGRLLTYRINEVRERSLNQRIASNGKPGQHRLVLHTSTGPPGTIPKLQVASRLIRAERTKKPAPKARPRPCSQPASSTAGNGRNPAKTRDPAVVTPIEGPQDDSMDPVSLIAGSVAVLLGATLIAVYLVRRQP
jgi:hypothetical protein